MLKKLLAGLSAVALALGLVALAAGPASAYDHAVTADCQTGVSVDLTDYFTSASKPTPNTVTVTLDGTVVADHVAFGRSFQASYAWSAVSASHSYRVVVGAADDPGRYKGGSFDSSSTVGGCAASIVAAAPTKSDPVCVSAGAIGGGGYTIPAAQPGVSYEYYNTASGLWVAIGAGTYSANPGTTIALRAVPASAGYTLSGKTTWTFTIANLYTFLCVVPTAPTATSAACVPGGPGESTGASYTVPTTSGVSYRLADGTPVSGTVNVTAFPSTVVINAVPTGSHIFPDSAQRQWTFTFSSAGTCFVTVTPATVTPQQSVCTGPGTSSTNGYTITPTTGVVYQLKSGSDWVTASNGFTDLGPAASTVSLRAVQVTGYELTGTQSWDFAFADAGACLTPTTVAEPSFVDGACDVATPGASTQGTYTIVDADHVTFQVKVNGGSFTAVRPGNYDAAPGDVVTIRVIADAGYTISPAPDSTKFTHTFAEPGLCLVDASFVAPAPTSQSCLPGDGGDLQLGGSGPATLHPAFITIPASLGAQFFIDGKAVASGSDYTLDPGTYLVTVAALSGYRLDPAATTSWTLQLTSAEPCGDLVTHPLVDPRATQVQLGCFTDGSYTLSNDLSDAAAITWTVNGSTVAQGTYAITAPGTVTVHATANGPDYGLESGATQDWAFTFAQPSTCELKTLAITGSTPTGWIVFGYLLLVSGLALVAVRFVRRRGEQS